VTARLVEVIRVDAAWLSLEPLDRPNLEIA